MYCDFGSIPAQFMKANVKHSQLACFFHPKQTVFSNIFSRFSVKNNIRGKNVAVSPHHKPFSLALMNSCVCRKKEIIGKLFVKTLRFPKHDKTK